jgi:hypothetical protein
MSNSKNNRFTSLSSTRKSCYRLYAGHGNWINLSAKTTQDLLQIFQKGDPCRYQLATGLFIDIIPNDVDCNSKNIDMLGLMRADLVYESQTMESHVQQLMAHYVRTLLDEQGIIDAFPPLRQGEDLPIITSIPTHRHLSLVPSAAGTVRRGPKSSNPNNNSIYRSSNGNSIKRMSRPSSLIGIGEEEFDPLFSSSSSSTTTTRGSSPIAKKKTGPTTRRTSKRARQSNSYAMPSIESTSEKIQSIQLELPDIAHVSSLSSCPPNLNLNTFVDNNHHHHQHSSSGDSTYNSGQNHSSPLTPMTFHSHPQQQQQQDSSANSTIWIPSYQNSPSSSTQRPSFNFEFGIDFDHSLQQQQRQSPTDILHEYDSHFSHQINGNSTFEGQHSLYSNSVPQALQHHHPQTLLEDQRDHSNSSQSPILDSFVPASPIPNGWIDHQQRSSDSTWVHTESIRNSNNDNQFSSDITTATTTIISKHKSDQKFSSKRGFEDTSLAYSELTNEANSTMTTLPVMDRIYFHQQQQKASNTSIFLSHAGGNSP